MSPRRSPGTSASRCPCPVSGLPYAFGAHLSLKPRAGRGKRIDGNIFVNVDGLGMLAQVVEPGESSGAVTLEWSFAGVFPCTKLESAHAREGCVKWSEDVPDVPCKMLAPREAQGARRIVGAIEALRLLFLI